MPEGIRELIAALEDARFGTPSMAGTGTSPSAVPLYDLRLEPEDIGAVMEGWGRAG